MKAEQFAILQNPVRCAATPCALSSLLCSLPCHATPVGVGQCGGVSLVAAVPEDAPEQLRRGVLCVGPLSSPCALVALDLGCAPLPPYTPTLSSLVCGRPWRAGEAPSSLAAPGCKNPNCGTCSTPTTCTSCSKGSISNGCEPDGPMCAERPDNASCTALGCGWCNTTLLCMLRYSLPTYCPTCESSGLEGPQCSRSPACKWCALEEKCMSASSACVRDCESISADAACERVPGCTWCPLVSSCINASASRTVCRDDCATRAASFCSHDTTCRVCNTTNAEETVLRCVLSSSTCGCDAAANESSCAAPCVWCASSQTCGNTACRNCSAARFRSRCGTGDLVGCAWCEPSGTCVDRIETQGPQCSCASAAASECKGSCKWCNSRGQCVRRSDQCPVCPAMTNSSVYGSYSGCTYDSGMGTCKDRSDSFTCGIVALPELCEMHTACSICNGHCIPRLQAQCMRTQGDSDQGNVELLSAVVGAAPLVPGMAAVPPSDSRRHVGLRVSRSVIDFNGEQLAVDKETTDTLTVTNVSRKTIVVRFVAEGFASTGPTGEGERCRVAVNQQLRVEMEPGAEYDIAVSVTPTTSGLGVVAVVPEGGCEYVAVPVLAATGPSARIEWSDIALGERIGEGGFGVVHRARWRGLDVAVKEMHGWLGQIDVLAEEMRREVHIMMALRSPHVVACYGYVLSDAHRALVMELSPLGSLSALIARPIEPAFKAKALLDCAEGMRLLHAHGILHRDLKPDNLLVFSMCVHDSVCVKLSDFGTSRAIGDDMARAYTKGVGTLLYMAPEIINGKPYNAKADVWSFAVLYHHVWTQEEPYSDLKNQGAIMSFVTSGHRLPIPRDNRRHTLSQMATITTRTAGGRRTGEEEAAAGLDAAATARQEGQCGGSEDEEPVEQRSPSPRVLRRRHARSKAPTTRGSLTAHLPTDIEQSLRRCGILTVVLPKPAAGAAWASFAAKII
eukprot:m51a1_g1514 putative protein serine threonine (961) ;mRNA; r:413079-421731